MFILQQTQTKRTKSKDATNFQGREVPRFRGDVSGRETVGVSEVHMGAAHIHQGRYDFVCEELVVADDGVRLRLAAPPQRARAAAEEVAAFLQRGVHVLAVRSLQLLERREKGQRGFCKQKVFFK